jgi:hypothetical protein
MTSRIYKRDIGRGLLAGVTVLILCAEPAAAQQAQEPQPRVVSPGQPGRAPSDAIVLFDGRDLSAWTTHDGRPPGWSIVDGAMTSTAKHENKEPTGTWDMVSKATFGGSQIHVEFSIPDMPGATGQAKGNSGVYLQGRYEVQILDSWRNPTYANGSNGALYGRFAPLVNASLPPGEWQTFDMVFHPPKCNSDGGTAQPGSLTVLHNQVLVQDHVPVTAAGKCESEPGPLVLQDHYHPDVKATPMRFRNIWVRPV